jgi:hypothetical protein
LLGRVNLVDEIMKALPLHRHRKLTQLSFREGNNSSAFFTVTFGTLIAKNCSTFCKFKTPL